MPKGKAGVKLGQNFLKSPFIASYIAALATAGPTQRVLEIGPGKGMLTRALLRLDLDIVAVEKDWELVALLQAKFANAIASGRLILKPGDILKLDTEHDLLNGRPYKVAANIPYYITGAIIKKFLTAQHQPTAMTLLVQKEVAERIAAKDGKESILSISAKAYGRPAMIRTVSRGNFSPQPKVDSAILHITGISRKFFIRNTIDENAYFALVRRGFSQKRKLLANSLTGFCSDPAGAIARAHITRNVRAEELAPEQWARLTKIVCSQEFKLQNSLLKTTL